MQSPGSAFTSDRRILDMIGGGRPIGCVAGSATPTSGANPRGAAVATTLAGGDHAVVYPSSSE
jgi:hypothetical protein